MQIIIHHRKLFSSGYYLSYFGLALVLVWLGVFKFTNAEALAIKPLLEHHPASGWLYGFLSYRVISDMVGVVEILTAVSLLVGLKYLLFRRITNVGIITTFVITLSFLFTTPGVFKMVEQLPVTDFFILKDTLLLGAGLMINNISINHKKP